MSKIFSFIKRNSFYFIIGLCVLIIACSLVLVAIYGFESGKVLEDANNQSPSGTVTTPTIPPEPDENVTAHIQNVFVLFDIRASTFCTNFHVFFTDNHLTAILAVICGNSMPPPKLT